MSWVSFADDQAASRVQLDDGRVLTKCDQCRQMYAERIPKQEPPCETCRVELLPANAEAASVYMSVRGQIVTFFNGERTVVVDVNHQSVHLAMDRLGVTKQRECFDKVVRTFHAMIKEKHG